MKFDKKEYFYRENKYYNIKLNRWIHSYKLEGSTYIFPEKYIIVNYPSIYTLKEIKEKYINRWLIPTSPEILVKHNNKLYKITELKEIW